jgi:hypothetical protein
MRGLTRHQIVEVRRRDKLVEQLSFLDCRERPCGEQVRDEWQPAGAHIAPCASLNLRGVTSWSS